MGKSKPLYDAGISYRTPAGRKVRYYRKIAANSLSECEDELRRLLEWEKKYGKRKVATVIGEFSATFITMQIETS